MATATDAFDSIAMVWILSVEGHYSADPEDHGNWTGGARGRGELRGTKYGISAASYPTLDIPHLSVSDARLIYRRDYWNKLHCDALPTAIALAVFDAAVNHGAERAATWLQLAVRAGVDGIVGPETIERSHSVDIVVSLPDFLSRRAVHYAQQNKLRYIRGWMVRLFKLMNTCARIAAALDLADSVHPPPPPLSLHTISQGAKANDDEPTPHANDPPGG